MRVFQIGNIYPAHLAQISKELDQASDYQQALKKMLSEVPHAQLLQPCIDEVDSSKVCYPQHSGMLQLWAREHGLPENFSQREIVYAMIEESQSEVFYSVNASSHSEEFMKGLPGCLRLKIGWLGSKNVGGGLFDFDSIVSNFNTINTGNRQLGMDVHYLAPSYETQTDRLLQEQSERPIDVLFIGTYSRHHRRRLEFTERLAQLADKTGFRVALHLLNSRYTWLAERTPLGLIPPFRDVVRPPVVREVALPPVFGPEMLRQCCRSKIVMNMAIDIAGADRGNMRCFEALSAGSLMISDEGDYPRGFEAGKTHLTYSDLDQALDLIETALADDARRLEVSATGAKMIRKQYSKDRQWKEFKTLVAKLLP